MNSGDSVRIINPKGNSYLQGQVGRVFSMQDVGQSADVDFPAGGLYRIPTGDLEVVATGVEATQ